MPRHRGRFATNFVPFSEFERDAAAGTLPDFSLIEPNLLAGHCDYHPAFGLALLPGVDVPIDPPSSILAGEAFLARIYRALKSASAAGESNVFNTTLFVGWDEPGGTYDHVPPGPVDPPQPSVPAGQLGFQFDRSGYRVPAVIVSPWIEQGVVLNDEYRHTSMIATLRKVWNLGEPFTARDAAARTFDDVFTLDVPREPDTWPEITPLPVPDFQMVRVARREAIGTLGKHICHGLLEHERRFEMSDRSGPVHPEDELSPKLVLDIVHRIGAKLFPRLAQEESPETGVE